MDLNCVRKIHSPDDYHWFPAPNQNMEATDLTMIALRKGNGTTADSTGHGLLVQDLD